MVLRPSRGAKISMFIVAGAPAHSSFKKTQLL